jgi:hypothetical protein
VPQADDIVLPLTLTLTVGIYLWAFAFRQDEGLRTLGLANLALWLSVLGLSVFWDVEVIAARFGTYYAANIATRQAYLPSATIFSKDNLLIKGPSVSERRIGDPESVYKYSYTGLLLLQRSSDRYFLLAVGAAPESGKLVIIKDSESIRIDLGN